MCYKISFGQSKTDMSVSNPSTRIRTADEFKKIVNNDYWVISEDCLLRGDSQATAGENSILITSLKQSVMHPKWILWYPHHWGYKGKDTAKNGYRNLFIDCEKDSQQLKETKKKIRQKTIIFARTDDLANAGIGQRGDSSNEECLEGIIDAIENDDYMQSLAGFAAIVIENGVDSAFLVQFEKKEDSTIQINHCQSFHRLRRTPGAYQHLRGYMSGIGAFMVASCLKKLIETPKTIRHKCKDCHKDESCEKVFAESRTLRCIKCENCDAHTEFKKSRENGRKNV